MHLFDYILHYATEKNVRKAISSGEREVNYYDLWQYISLNRSIMKKHGITENDNIMILYEDPIDWIVGFLSAMSLNCNVLPVDTGISQEKINGLKTVLKDIKMLNNDNFSISYKKNDGYYDFSDEIDEEKTCILHLTSGSTSEPKLCQRTLKSLTVEGNSFKEALGITIDDIILGLPPLYHSYALGASLMTSLISGSQLIQVKEFKPRNTLKLIINKNVTIMILVPLMAKVLSSIAIKMKSEKNKLRFAMSGAGKVDQEMFDMFYNAFGVDLLCNYGSTETGGLITRVESKYIGSLGKPMPGVEIKIKNNSGNKAAVDEQGEMWVKSNEIMKSYYGKESPFDDNGFYPTGDIVYQNAEGYIFLVGRKKNVVKIGGKTVDLSTIRETLLSMKGVSECAVFAVEKNDSIHVKAVINSVSEYSKEEVIAYCKQKIDKYHVPHEVIFSDELRKNSIGKLDVSKFIS